MKFLTILVLLLSLLAVALPAGAEVSCGPPGVTASLDPQSALIGEPIQVTLTNYSSQTITLFDSCVYQGVYLDDSCGGSFVSAPSCYQLLTPIGPGQSLTQSWGQSDDNGQQVPNGTYFIATEHDSGSCCQELTISNAVPALNRWGISALVGFVGLAGIWAFKKRRALQS